MKEFRCRCVDDKTGYEMVLSEVSYNMACDWLDRCIREEGSEIARIEFNTDNGLYEIFTETYMEVTHEYIPNRKFYYDEKRGYLMGE